MAFNGRPWAIENAATNAATARGFANAATQDSQGINLPGDFAVTALGTPGLAVNIAPGGMTLVNRQAKGQSYIGIAEEVTQYPVPRNNTGVQQNHILLARVRDPDFAPWEDYETPEEILYGPYFEPFLVSGASVTTTNAYQLAEVNYTAEALARIEMPAGASQVLPQYIKPLRRLARPRFAHLPNVKAIATLQYMLLTHTAWRDWPIDAAWLTDVPPWATHVLVDIDLNGIKANGPGDIDFRINFAGLTGGTSWFDYNGNGGTPAGLVEVLQHATFAEFEIPTNLRGGAHTVKLQGMRTYADANKGDLWVEPRKQVRLGLTYMERVA